MRYPVGFFNFLENTEDHIHQTLKAADPNMHPPKLIFHPIDSTTCEIEYSSERHMCFVGEGIIQAAADYYHEKVKIGQPSCMCKGASVCRIRVELI